jgi:hypothetical protein
MASNCCNIGGNGGGSCCWRSSLATMSLFWLVVAGMVEMVVTVIFRTDVRKEGNRESFNVEV